MRLNDDYNNNKRSGGGFSVTTIAVGVSVCVLAILGVVVMANQKPAPAKTAIAVQTKEAGVDGQSEPESEAAAAASDKSVDELVSGSTLTSNDLEFWSFFRQEEKMSEEAKAAEEADKKKKAEEAKKEEETQEADTEHAKQTLIKKENGAEEWIPINPYLTKNEYDYTGLVYQDPIMKYFENSRQISFMGIDVSKEQGVVDYNKVKKAGVDFAMIKVGARGYGTGQIIMDDNFEKNIKGAVDAGLSVGVYFFSQAINEEEALEEANFVLEKVKDYKITYPVAYDMEQITGDTARTAELSQEVKSKIAAVFLKTMSDSGYKTVIYGNKEWLLQKINLSLLSEYNIWLAQEADIPDYPYKFSMWQYSTQGTISGISGKVDLNISFVDYDSK